jgi:ATP-binding cassette, subfamily B, multidrug efflux pump
LRSFFRSFERWVEPYPAAIPPTPPRSLIAFVWAASEGVRLPILVMALLTAVIGVFEAWLFSLLGQVVDWLDDARPGLIFVEHGLHLATLAGLLLASIGIVALQSAVKHQALAGNFPMRLRWNFHRLMLGQSLGFYQDEFAGRVATKLMQTALAVRDAVFILGEIMIFVTIYFGTLVLVVGSFHLWMVLPFLGWLLVYGGAVLYFVPRLADAGQAQADARSLMTGRITDAYANIPTVKLFSHTRREALHARDAMEEFLVTVHRQMRLVTAFEVVNHTASMALVVGAGGMVLWLWNDGIVGSGAVAAATAMAIRLNGISHWVMWEMASLFEHIGTIQDGVGTLARPPDVVDAPDAGKLVVQRGKVRFEGVSFAYPGGPTVIHQLDLHIRPGEKLGLVGRSGAGKSTLTGLLLRFHDIREGRVLIDGQDIMKVTQDSLRAHIGLVTQDNSLLHRSVRDNILYGRPGASEAELIDAARRAEALGFIADLRDPKGRSGFDAHVGERGVKLSGGQRQRIAIARVMLKDAPILVLDEATSALDSEVEAAIQSSLYRLMEGKTVLAIAHRLSTIAAMDRLIVLDGGRIVEEGDHQSLLRARGLYARLWAHQSGGFLGEVA